MIAKKHQITIEEIEFFFFPLATAYSWDQAFDFIVLESVLKRRGFFALTPVRAATKTARPPKLMFVVDTSFCSIQFKLKGWVSGIWFFQP